MQDLKVRGVRAAWVYFLGYNFGFLKFSRDSVESTESVEFKANYRNIQFLILNQFD